MSESQSIPSRCLHLLRVHFVPISIVTVASFMLVPALFAIMRAVILSQPGASQLSPTALWESSSATVKTLAILIFLLATFLPQSLTEAGIAAIALSEAKNESIELRRLFGQLARSFPRILVLTLILGFVKVLGASTVVISVGVALSCALVMPVAGTTRLGPWISLKTGVKLAAGRIGPIALIYFSALAALIPVLLAVFVLFERLAEESSPSVVQITLLMIALLFVIAGMSMIRSSFMAVVYVDAVKKRSCRSLSTSSSV